MTKGSCFQTGDTLQDCQQIELFKISFINTLTRNASSNGYDEPNIPKSCIDSAVSEEKNKALHSKKIEKSLVRMATSENGLLDICKIYRKDP